MNAAVSGLRAGDSTPLRELLKRRPKEATKPQVILEAARLGNLAALKLLAKAGADLNASWRGYRPLHALIQEKPHGDEIAKTGKTPRERLAALDWLLSSGADPELTGAWPPARAVLIAAFVGSRDFLDCLFEHGARKDFFTACATGDLAAVRRALSRDPSLAQARDVGGLSALQCCAGSRLHSDAKGRKRSCEIASLCLDAGADPNLKTKAWSDEVDVCYFSIGAGNAELTELLLARGADATEALTTAMWQDGRLELAETCLAHGARPDRAIANGKPLLNDLVRWGRFDAAEWLLAHGAGPDVADENGWTALFQAASRGSVRMARALLDAGAERGKKDRSGLTALDVARAAKKTKIVELLA
jgi:ankyrin repeat protein